LPKVWFFDHSQPNTIQSTITTDAMRTDNSDSEKDLNANPESELNTNRPVSKPDDKFPESRQAKDEAERVRKQEGEDKPADTSDIELLANEVQGTVGSRESSSDPDDIAGVADLDRGMKRGKRR
jgi:hypothetical protein